MKNYKKILSFTLALIMALSVSAVSITAAAAGSASGTVVLNETFETGSPAAGTSIYDYNQGVWTQTLNGYVDGTANSVNTIKDVSGNKVASLERTVMDIADTSKGYTSYSMKTNLKALDAETKLVNIDFRLRAMNANTDGLEVEIFDSTSSDTVYFFMEANAVWGDYSGAIRDQQVTYKPDTEWNDIKIVMDYTTGEEKIYVNGVLCIDHETENTTKDKFVNGITGLPIAIEFGTPRGTGYKGAQDVATTSAEFQLDDIVVTGYTAADLAAIAEQEVDAALAKLSDVTVIKTAENLSLPTASDLGTTATVTWTSDNTAVLAHNGAVTKAQTAQTAKLTATISSGSVTKTKVFDVTVLPANVYFYEGFNSVTTLSGDNLEGYNNWKGGTEYAGYTVDSVFTAQKDSENNYYGSLLREKSLAITGGYQSRYWELNKVVAAQTEEANGGQSFSFKLKRDANSKNINAVLYGPKINTSGDYSTIEFKTDNHSVTIGGTSYYYSEAIMNDWLNVELIYRNGGVVLYVNGAPLTKADGTAMSPISTTWNPVTKIGFAPTRTFAAVDGNNPTTFMLDDVCIKTLSADYVSCVSAKDSLSFANPVVSDLDITDEVNGTTIILNSSKPEVIANDGKVTRPDAEALTPVTLTVTITKGSEGVTQTYNVNVAPKYLAKIRGIYVAEETSMLDTIKLTNYAKLEKAAAFAAVYTKNSDGAYVLKGVQKADDITYITAKGSQEIGFAENKLTVGKDDVIKVFLWNDSNSLIPIAKSFSHEYSAEETE